MEAATRFIFFMFPDQRDEKKRRTQKAKIRKYGGGGEEREKEGYLMKKGKKERDMGKK